MLDCIIIGGGIIGMLTARSLLRRGYKVTVVEKGPFGQEASWAGGGILSPLYPWRYAEAVNQLVSVSHRIYPDLIEDLISVSGIDAQFSRSGLLILDVNDMDQATRWAERRGINYIKLGAAAVEKMEPALSINSQFNMCLPDIAQVRNPRFLKAIMRYLEVKGASMLADSEVITVDINDQRVHGVTTANGRKLEAKNVVVANGAWSGRLLQQTGMELPIRPVRGQMLLLQTRPDLLGKIVLQDNRYLIPRNDGRIVVGSTVENAGFDKSTTDLAFGELKQFAVERISKLHNARILRHWAGLRPGCGEGIPYIGPHPSVDGLYINAGHFRNGIVMAPASAELLAALINGEQPEIDSGPYNRNHPLLPEG